MANDRLRVALRVVGHIALDQILRLAFVVWRFELVLGRGHDWHIGARVH